MTGECHCILRGEFERVNDGWLVERLSDTHLLNDMSCGIGNPGGKVILSISVLSLVSLTEFGSRLIH